jgi:hypothetical protein
MLLALEPRRLITPRTIGTGRPASTRRGRRHARDVVAAEATGVQFTGPVNSLAIPR